MLLAPSVLAPCSSSTRFRDFVHCARGGVARRSVSPRLSRLGLASAVPVGGCLGGGGGGRCMNHDTVIRKRFLLFGFSRIFVQNQMQRLSFAFLVCIQHSIPTSRH